MSMVLRPTLCRECFKKGYDDTAKDQFLLLSKDNYVCEFCKTEKPLVVRYFKWGEHTTTADGKRVKDAVRHLGVNPNYSCWGDTYPYNDRVVTKS